MKNYKIELIKNGDEFLYMVNQPASALILSLMTQINMQNSLI